MERDWDVIEDLLETLEQEGPVAANSRRTWLEKMERIGLDDYEEKEALYHLNLLQDAGFVRMRYRAKGSSGPLHQLGFAHSLDEIRGLHMTLEGHDLLDELRSPGNYERIRRAVEDA